MRLRIFYEVTSVRLFVRPPIFSNDEFSCFEGKKQWNDIMNDGTMSGDKVVAFNVPRGTFYYHPLPLLPST